jgi:hypothetical protein
MNVSMPLKSGEVQSHCSSDPSALHHNNQVSLVVFGGGGMLFEDAVDCPHFGAVSFLLLERGDIR